MVQGSGEEVPCLECRRGNGLANCRQPGCPPQRRSASSYWPSARSASTDRSMDAVGRQLCPRLPALSSAMRSMALGCLAAQGEEEL